MQIALLMSVSKLYSAYCMLPSNLTIERCHPLQLELTCIDKMTPSLEHRQQNFVCVKACFLGNDS